MLVVKKNFLSTQLLLQLLGLQSLKIGLITFILILSCRALAQNPDAFEPQKNSIAFFKSKDSQFSSGEASLSRLSENIINRAQDLNKIENDFYQFGQQKISKSMIKPTFAKDLSINAGYRDLGQFLTLKESYLKTYSQLNSPSIVKIPENTKLSPLKFENGFIQILFNGKKGFVDISNCISKFDFANAIYAVHPKTKQKQWHYVKTRIFDQIETYDHQQINMSQVEGIFTNDKMAIVTTKNAELPLWSKVFLKTEIISASQKKWNQSYLSGHGFVWWSTGFLNKKNSTSLDINELLKKEIYSISTHPKDPKKSIVSIPDGVFITSDGETWLLITQFKKFKGPVYYYNDNLIFVGTFRSTNQAKSFEPFINVGTLSAIVKNTIGYNPTSLKIKKIKSNASSQITIDVDTGYKSLKLQSMIYSQNWEVVQR